MHHSVDQAEDLDSRPSLETGQTEANEARDNNINYSLDNQNNILCYRLFYFTSEVFIRQHESRRRELPIGTSFYILTTATEVSPDEDFRREVETLITKYFYIRSLKTVKSN